VVWTSLFDFGSQSLLEGSLAHCPAGTEVGDIKEVCAESFTSLVLATVVE